MTSGEIARDLTEKFKVEERTAKGVQSFKYNFNMEYKPVTLPIDHNLLERLGDLGWGNADFIMHIDSILRDEISRQTKKQSIKTPKPIIK